MWVEHLIGGTPPILILNLRPRQGHDLELLIEHGFDHGQGLVILLEVEGDLWSVVVHLLNAFDCIRVDKSPDHKLPFRCCDLPEELLIVLAGSGREILARSCLDEAGVDAVALDRHDQHALLAVFLVAEA